MKKSAITMLSAALILMLTACGSSGNEKSADNSKKEPVILTASAEADKVEVLYFHLTRRCATCNAIEEVAKKTIDSQFAEMVTDEKVVMKSINYETDEGRYIAQQHDVTGQALLLVAGQTKVDLTATGFMNAMSNPKKLEEEITNNINELLKNVK